jgi:hypothetical protein
MKTPMLGTAHDKQVFDPIVESVTVDMVHNLIGRQFPAKVLLDKMAVLGNLAPRYRYVPILALDPTFALPSSVVASNEPTGFPLRIKICSVPTAAAAGS